MMYAALLEGMLRAKRDAEEDSDDGTVTLMVLLSNGPASVGATNRSKIASDVWKSNQEGKVKMFSLAFSNADQELLRAIAIMNGGVTASILPTEGQVGYASQIESFFESEFGSVLLSDVHVSFDKDAGAYGETQKYFPVLADGSEIVVRGLLQANQTLGDSILQVFTTATTATGEEKWTATAVKDPFVQQIGLPNSRCFQSYAHTRITQLLHLRDVATLLGDGVVEPIVSLAEPCDKEKMTLAECIEQEALSLALRAKVVTRGLTGMVTVDEDECFSLEGETDICLDGTSKGEYWEAHAEDAEGGYAYASSAPRLLPFASFSSALFAALLYGSLVLKVFL